MKCNAKELYNSLAGVAKFAPSRSVQPVILGVKIAVNDGYLTAIATDLETTAKSAPLPVEVQFDEAWETVIQTNVVEWLGTIKGEVDVTFDAKTQKIKLRANGAKLDSSCMNAEDYPRIPMETAAMTEISAASLVKVAFAASIDPSNRVLTSINFACNGDRLMLSAADGYRMAFVSQACDLPPCSYNVPAMAIKNLLKMGFKEIKLGFTDRNAIFECNGMVIVSQLVEGNFPDIHRIVPQNSITFVEFKADDLKEAVNRAEKVKPDNNTVRIDFLQDQFTLSAISAEGGSGDSTVTCKTTGPILNIAFNGGFIKEAISVRPGDTVKVALTEPSRPALITVDSDPHWGCVVMPMHIGK